MVSPCACPHGPAPAQRGTSSVRVLEWRGVLDGTAADVRRFVVALAETDSNEMPSELSRDLVKLVPDIGETLRVEIRERHHADAVGEVTMAAAPNGVEVRVNVDVHPHGKWHVLALVPAPLRRRAVEPAVRALDELPSMLSAWRAGTPVEKLAERWTPPSLARSPERIVETPVALLPAWADTDRDSLDANRAGLLTTMQRRKLWRRWRNRLLLIPFNLGLIAGSFVLVHAAWPVPLFLLVAVPCGAVLAYGTAQGQWAWVNDLRRGSCVVAEGAASTYHEPRGGGYTVRVGGERMAQSFMTDPGLVNGARYRVFYLPHVKEMVNIEAAPPPEHGVHKPSPITIRWTRLSSRGRRVVAGEWTGAI